MIERCYSFLDKFSIIINKFAKLLIIILLAIMCTFTVAQIFFRYILNSALTWPEELNVFLMAWITFVGSSIAIKENEHIGISMFVDMLPQKIAFIVRLIGKFVVIYCVFLITKYGYNLALMNLTVTSDALGISMFIPRISLVVGGLMMFYQSFYLIMLDLRDLLGKRGII